MAFFVRSFACAALILATALPVAAGDLRLVHDITADHPRIPHIEAMVSAASADPALLTLQVNPGGVVHPGYAGVEALENGVADVALVNASNLERIDPRMGFVNLPFTLNDTLMANPVVRNGVVAQLDLLAHEKGWRVLGLMRGADQLFAFSEEMPDEPSELSGLAIRVAGSGIYEAIMQGYGAEPVVMPFPELKNAFAENRVQGVFTSPGGWASQLGMEVPNALQVPGLMMITYAVIIRAKQFDALAEDERAALTQAVESKVTSAWEVMLADDEAEMEELKTNGARVVRVEADGAWRQPVASISAGFAADYPDVWESLQVLLSKGARE
ncbi:TRAP transporter substrate-binding protein DctP [Aquamicrobium sp. LC103]|uniref:TRAP transporter substrate-binding protein n=1 Tax=Aquamicrobium sp. LC103 TaxID=1120658 RepID=UPI00063E6EFC|nr:TRAP transporter substrate-binding protein DctP [Aquamicrobium sp. LC103]TKT69805.1 hypothetical protein XW59_025275 [Aquamicrobium sp. LC103]